MSTTDLRTLGGHEVVVTVKDGGGFRTVVGMVTNAYVDTIHLATSEQSPYGLPVTHVLRSEDIDGVEVVGRAPVHPAVEPLVRYVGRAVEVVVKGQPKPIRGRVMQAYEVNDNGALLLGTAGFAPDGTRMFREPVLASRIESVTVLADRDSIHGDEAATLARTRAAYAARYGADTDTALLNLIGEVIAAPGAFGVSDAHAADLLDLLRRTAAATHPVVDPTPARLAKFVASVLPVAAP